MLEERTEIGVIEVLQSGKIQVRTDTVVLRDDIEISRSFHRHVISQGDDISGEDALVRSVATAAWGT